MALDRARPESAGRIEDFFSTIAQERGPVIPARDRLRVFPPPGTRRSTTDRDRRAPSTLSYCNLLASNAKTNPLTDP